MYRYSQYNMIVFHIVQLCVMTWQADVKQYRTYLIAFIVNLVNVNLLATIGSDIRLWLSLLIM